MSDLIDRQAIMKEFADFVRKSNNSDFAQTPTWNDAVSLVGSMPSAQPETNCSEFPNNSDTISRQAAIDALNEYFARIGKLKRRGLTKGEKAISLDTVGVIKTMPSAQPQRKKGEWIYNSPVTMKCNQCGLVIKDWDWHRFKYCPNCCSDMRGERE